MKIVNISMSQSSANELLDFMIVLYSAFQKRGITAIHYESGAGTRHGVRVDEVHWQHDMVRVFLPYQRLNIRFHDEQTGACYLLYRIRP